MKLPTWYVLGIGALGLGCASSGCSAVATDESVGEETAVRADGLTIVEADEAAGKLVLSYAKAGRAVTFETYVGEELENQPSPESLTPEQRALRSSHGVEARILDNEGQPFMGQGSRPDWGSPEEVDEDLDELSRLQDMELAVEASAALRTLQVPAALDDGRKTALQFALTLDESINPVTKDGVQLISRKDRIKNLIEMGDSKSIVRAAPKAVGYSLSNGDTVGKSTKSYKWDYVVNRENLDWFSLTHHSAVIARRWTTDSVLNYQWASCNHGSCAYNLPIRHCTMSGFRSGTGKRYFYGETATRTNERYGGCDTNYGTHSCNDDSMIQGRAIYNNTAQSTTGATCQTFAIRAPYPPGCN